MPVKGQGSRPRPERRLEGPRPERRVKVRVLDDGAIEVRQHGDPVWYRATRSRLARDFGVDHPVWVELRAAGIERPRAAGGACRPNAQRERRLYTVRLLPEEASKMDALARKLGICRSALVVRLVEQAEVREKTKKIG